MTASKKPSVWIISKDGKNAALRSPANAHFWREYFYDLTSVTGQRNQLIENTLSKIEGWTSDITIEQLDQRKPMGQAEAESLDLFVACMWARIEKLKGGIQSFAEAKAGIEREHAIAYGLPQPDNDVGVQNAHAFSVLTALEAVPKEIASWTHEVFIAPVGNSFITSDCPCVWEATLGPAGLKNRFLEISLPLSPKHLLFISKEQRPSAYREIPDDLVDYLNWRTIRHCEKYFVSNQNFMKRTWFESEAYWFN